MKKKLVICCLLLFFFVLVKGQNQGNIWCFGDSALIDFNGSFATTHSSSIVSKSSSFSLADSLGNLLFYGGTFYGANNCTSTLIKSGVIYDRSNNIMINGDSIVGIGANHNNMVAVPDPANSTLFYVFSIYNTFSPPYGIVYSKIDMSLNNGNGEVIEKNIILDSTIQLTGGLKAVKHGNGNDWWILAHDNYSTNGQTGNTFAKYLVSSTGIIKVTQNIGAINNTGNLRIIISPDGTSIATINVLNLFETYSFDRCSGILSNYRLINPESNNSTLHSGYGDFSPNGRYMYISQVASAGSPHFLSQFDLWSTNPWNSQIALYSNQYPSELASIKRAPDNKIFVTSAYGYCFPYPDSIYNQYNMNLTVIESPDSGGLACNVQPFSFFLGGKRTYFGLPNNPDYTLGALPNPCPVGITEQTLLNNSVSVSPNPAASNVKIESSYFIKKIKLVSVTGALVFVKEVSATKINLETENYSEGIYSLIIETEKGVVIKKLVVM